MGDGGTSAGFIPSEITTAITTAIGDAQQAITNVITDNFDTLMLIVGTAIGVSVALWVIGLVRRFMRGR